MKILQINSVCGVGSTGRIATDLYKVLEEQGHECKIAYGRGIAPEGINSIKIGSKLDNYTHVFKTRVFDKHGFGSVNATKKFIEKVKEYDPDIIHLHNIHGYYINIEILFNYLKEANKLVIWTLHDCWALTGHCAYFDYVGCDKWKNRCSDCPQKQGYPSSKILDNSKLNYEKKKELFTSVKNMTIVTPSKWLANLVKESFLRKYQVEVINNGIDLDIFKPTRSNFRKKYNIEDKFIVLGVANMWDERKGLKYFVDISKELDDDYKVVIVGVNERQKRELGEYIIAIDRTNNIQELAGIYTTADLFLNPSAEETMGLVTVEAMACGLPVIVSNRTAIPEVIDQCCGIIIPELNSNEIIKQIDLFRRKKITSTSCINKSKQYDKKKMAIEYMRIYEK
jgi:glycosyltransferase involved in cell wall biosynthesis